MASSFVRNCFGNRRVLPSSIYSTCPAKALSPKHVVLRSKAAFAHWPRGDHASEMTAGKSSVMSRQRDGCTEIAEVIVFIAQNDVSCTQQARMVPNQIFTKQPSFDNEGWCIYKLFKFPPGRPPVETRGRPWLRVSGGTPFAQNPLQRDGVECRQPTSPSNGVVTAFVWCILLWTLVSRFSVQMMDHIASCT